MSVILEGMKHSESQFFKRAFLLSHPPPFVCTMTAYHCILSSMALLKVPWFSTDEQTINDILYHNMNKLNSFDFTIFPSWRHPSSYCARIIVTIHYHLFDLMTNSIILIFSAWLENYEDPLIKLVDDRVGAYSGLNMKSAEGLQVFCYEI